MITHQMLKKFWLKDHIFAAYIGVGHFGTAVVTQQMYVDDLSIVIVADKNPESARQSFLKAGIPEESTVYCDTAEAASACINQGLYVYTDRAEIIMKIPKIDIVCEGTGVPEASARYCRMAIESGKHVAIVSKETDSVIGPILKKLADEAGVVYTPVDGDQHGLLIQLFAWAKEIGLTVISAGKARDAEFVYDEEMRTVSVEADGITVHKSASVHISDEDALYFKKFPGHRAMEYITKRAKALKDLPCAGAFDLCELTIMANATGLKPYTPSLTQGTLRITELPVAYCSTRNGGIYADSIGFIDVMTCLRRSDESGMGGGVYLVVRCDNAYSNYILTTKGQISNETHTAAVIYRPYHLCGVEVSTTLKSAAMLGVGTGSDEYLQRCDLVKKAGQDIPAGEILGNDHDLRMTGMIVPATVRGESSPVPGHMLDGNRAKIDIRAGEMITYAMVEKPDNSVLWNLRALQEEGRLR
ncbi:MAG TPA: flagellar biosynthesis protein FlgA [Clostridia bacterium]